MTRAPSPAPARPPAPSSFNTRTRCSGGAAVVSAATCGSGSLSSGPPTLSGPVNRIPGAQGRTEAPSLCRASWWTGLVGAKHSLAFSVTSGHFSPSLYLRVPRHRDRGGVGGYQVICKEFPRPIPAKVPSRTVYRLQSPLSPCLPSHGRHSAPHPPRARRPTSRPAERGLVRGSALSSPPRPEQLSGSALARRLSHSGCSQRRGHLRPSQVLEAEEG